jgi:hypothetical protein
VSALALCLCALLAGCSVPFSEEMAIGQANSQHAAACAVDQT